MAESSASAGPYDALLFVSFGGPDGPEDVIPFLENVTRGRGVPPERLREVAGNYDLFGGKSPINEQNLALIAALEVELARSGPHLPIYFGNRHWKPTLEDAIGRMANDGVRRAVAFFTSAYSSYSGCRAYREDIEKARAQIGEKAPEIDKVRAFWNHPGFVEPMATNVLRAVEQIPVDRRERIAIAYTAHSIPLSMSEKCDYLAQLREVASLIDDRIDGVRPGELVFQSRSGPPQQPWLEPDIVDHLDALHRQGVADVVVAPIGFICDHMEVLYDLDTQAAERASDLGLNMVRAATVGVDPAFVEMIAELIQERVDPDLPRRTLGSMGPRRVPCAPDCCPAPQRPAGGRPGGPGGGRPGGPGGGQPGGPPSGRPGVPPS